MFYPMAGSKLYIGSQIAMSNTDIPLATFQADLGYSLLNEVESMGNLIIGSKPVEFDPLWPAFKRRVKGGRDYGTMELLYASDTADVQQNQLTTAEQSSSDYTFKLILADQSVYSITGVVTITIAAPGVFTLTGHGLKIGSQIKLTTTGALPTGLLPATTYYVVSVTANTFTVSATPGGAPITTTVTQSGVHTVTSTPTPSERYWIAKVMQIEDVFGDGPEAVFKRKATLAVNGKPQAVSALP